jgi:integrase
MATFDGLSLDLKNYEAVRLINAPDRSRAEGARDHALLVVLARTSLRVSEVRNLRASPSFDISSSRSRRFIPIEEAGKRMGLNREWVNFHVSTGLLKSHVGVSDPQMTLIDAKSTDT